MIQARELVLSQLESLIIQLNPLSPPSRPSLIQALLTARRSEASDEALIGRSKAAKSPTSMMLMLVIHKHQSFSTAMAPS
jgi:hypothetical protein